MASAAAHGFLPRSGRSTELPAAPFCNAVLRWRSLAAAQLVAGTCNILRWQLSRMLCWNRPPLAGLHWWRQRTLYLRDNQPVDEQASTVPQASNRVTSSPGPPAGPRAALW